MNNEDAYRSPQSDVRDSYEGGEANVKPFTTKGRLGRAYYVIYSAGLATILQIGLLVLVAGLGAVSNEAAMGVGVVVAGLTYLVVVVFQFIWAIRRAHDADMSGWMSLLLIVPLAFLVFWFIPGTQGPNKYGPAPKRGPLWLAIIIGLIIPAIFILGIFAAIAIPAYQDYTQRAQVGECMAASSGVRQAMAESWQNTGHFPDDRTINSIMPERPIESKYCFIDMDTASERVMMTFKSDASTGIALQGNSFYYEFEVINDRLEKFCGSDTIPSRFLPRSCQRDY